MTDLGPPCAKCGAPRDDHYEYHCVFWEAPKPKPPSQDSEYVAMPTSVKQAEAMLLVAEAYLKANR